MSLSGLIDRMQKAEAPDRDLDAEVYRVCVGEVWSGPLSGHWTSDGKAPIPHYTASIDDALTLVPDEHDWIIASVNGQVGGTPYACVGSEQAHYGATPALSLCLAALKARANGT
jgi:hypothetical protein